MRSTVVDNKKVGCLSIRGYYYGATNGSMRILTPEQEEEPSMPDHEPLLPSRLEHANREQHVEPGLLLNLAQLHPGVDRRRVNQGGPANIICRVLVHMLLKLCYDLLYRSTNVVVCSSSVHPLQSMTSIIDIQAVHDQQNTHIQYCRDHVFSILLCINGVRS